MALFGRIVLAGDDDLSNHSPAAPDTPEQREKSIHADILNRLRSVCKDLPEEEFQDLVAAMTREQLRSERLH